MSALQAAKIAINTRRWAIRDARIALKHGTAAGIPSGGRSAIWLGRNPILSVSAQSGHQDQAAAAT
jgi:hypothetical protein